MLRQYRTPRARREQMQATTLSVQRVRAVGHLYLISHLHLVHDLLILPPLLLQIPARYKAVTQLRQNPCSLQTASQHHSSTDDAASLHVAPRRKTA
eukprot:1805720-Rhodomonas_salina.1